jgi:hypothetical protein
MILIYYAFDTHLIRICYACDTHHIVTHDTHFVRMIRIWYAVSDTHRYAYGTHLLVTHVTHLLRIGTHLLRISYAYAYRVFLVRGGTRRYAPVRMEQFADERRRSRTGL